jgi:hypothetical protein
VSAKTAQRPLRSGFCNPAHDEESHARCRMAGCCCPHHTATTVEVVLPGLLAVVAVVDQALPSDAVDAAAAALAEGNRTLPPNTPDPVAYRQLAEAALTAALPHLGGAA